MKRKRLHPTPTKHPAAPFWIQPDFAPKGAQPLAIEALCQGLRRGDPKQVLLGVTGSGKTFTMAHVIASEGRPALILAPNKTLAAQLYAELKALFPNNAVEYFVSYYDYYRPEAYLPSSDTYIEKDAAINEQIEQMRLSATKSLLERRDTIVVASVSCIYGLGDPSTFKNARLTFQKGLRYPREALLRQLAQMQYRRKRQGLIDRGSFKVDGEVMDLFPAEEESHLLRLTFLGEQLESMMQLDTETGEIHENLSQYTLYPRNHYISEEAQKKIALRTIREELDDVCQKLRGSGHGEEARRLQERVSRDIEMIQESGSCPGIENYSRHFSGRNSGDPPPTLLEYFPEDGILFIDESHVTLPQLRAMHRGDRARKVSLVAYGFRLPSAFDNRPLTFEEFETIPLQTIYVSATPGTYELQQAQGAVIEQLIRPTGLLDPVIEVRPTKTQMPDLLDEIHQRRAKQERVCLLTLTKKMAEDLSHYLEEEGIASRYLHSNIDTIERMEILKDLRRGNLDAIVGVNLLREGIDLPEVSLIILLDADKEGFLRSPSALIQIVGRAARHLNGKAIFYADRITKAMKQAIQETERRRQLQEAYNLQHHIKPAPILKPVLPSLQDYILNKETDKAPSAKETKSAEALSIRKLKAAMRRCAERLDFEKALEIKKQIDALQSKKELS